MFFCPEEVSVFKQKIIEGEKDPGLNLTQDHAQVDHWQCSPYQAVTSKIYGLKQQQATVLTNHNLLIFYYNYISCFKKYQSGIVPYLLI